MNVLFLSNWYPYPPSNGSKLRVYNLLRGLAREHRVTLLTFTDDAHQDTPPELAAICERVHALPRPPFRPRSAQALAGLFSPMPRSLLSTRDPRLASTLHQELEANSYDLLLASQWAMTPYVLEVPGIPAIFEEVELGLFATAVEQAPTAALRLRHWLTLWKLGRYLRRALHRFAACTVVSDAEAGLVRRFVPDCRTVVVVPNGVDVPSCADVMSTPHPGLLIYTGALSYFANYEAVSWFVRQILPLVRLSYPGVRLMVTGDPGGRAFPDSDGIELTGFVDDVRPLVASSWASVAPLRTGGGTRLKILEAMALRTPVVATRKGAEGLDVDAGRHLLLADTTHDFADAVVRLLADSGLRQMIVDEAFQLVSGRYDWSVTLPPLLELAERAVTGRSSAVRA